MKVGFQAYDSLVVFLLLFFLYFSYFSNFLNINAGKTSLIQSVALIMLLSICLLKLNSIKFSKLIILILLVIFLISVYFFSNLSFIDKSNFDKTYKFFSLLFFSGYIGIFLIYIDKKKLNYGIFNLSTIFVLLNLFWANESSSGTSRLVLGDMNPIWNARLIGICLLYSLIEIMFFKKRSFKILILALISAYTIFKTGSRGPIVGIVISLAFIYIFFSLNSFKKILNNLGFIIFSIISYTYLILYTNILDNLDLLDLSSGRVELYRIAIKLFIKHPLGSGLGGFGNVIRIDGLSYPHNIFLESLAETGFVFTILLFSIILLSTKRAIYITKNNPSNLIFIFAILIYSIVNAMFSGDLTSPKEMYIIMFLFLFFPKNQITVKPPVQS